jgi:hypothetical protein
LTDRIDRFGKLLLQLLDAPLSIPVCQIGGKVAMCLDQDARGVPRSD